MEIFDLPWDHIIFRHIFIHLSLKDICRLSRVCRQFQQMSKAFFNVCSCYDFSGPIGTVLSKRLFKSLTNDNSSIKTLILDNCKCWIDDEVLVPVLQLNSLIRNLSLSECSGLTNRVVHTIALSNSNLRELSFERCRWLSSDALLEISFNCRKLRKLNLSGCWNINDESVSSLAIANQELNDVNLSDCYSITNFSVISIAKNCRNLERLAVRGCWRVTDAAIKLLREYSKQLHTLSVKECRDITEFSLALLRAKGVLVDVDRPWYVAGNRNILFQDMARLQPPPFVNLQI